MNWLVELKIHWHMWRAERLEVTDLNAAVLHLHTARRIARESSQARLDRLEAQRLAKLAGRV